MAHVQEKKSHSPVVGGQNSCRWRSQVEALRILYANSPYSEVLIRLDFLLCQSRS